MVLVAVLCLLSEAVLLLVDPLEEALQLLFDPNKVVAVHPKREEEDAPQVVVYHQALSSQEEEDVLHDSWVVEDMAVEVHLERAEGVEDHHDKDAAVVAVVFYLLLLLYELYLLCLLVLHEDCYYYLFHHEPRRPDPQFPTNATTVPSSRGEILLEKWQF